jgi:subtilisin family serine protease
MAGEGNLFHEPAELHLLFPVRKNRGSSTRPFRPEQLEARTLLSAAISTAQNPDTSRIIVAYKSSLALLSMSAPAGAHVAQAIDGADRTEIVTVDPKVSLDSTLAKLRANPNVRYAEPDYKVTTDVVPNDMYYQNGTLWGMEGDQSTPASANGSGAAEAWANDQTGTPAGAAPVYVGIIDEGIDFNHPDLIGNVWTNPYDTPGDGIDNDGNSYIDDTHGWDFYHNDNTIYDGNGGDQHGTHVTGTIAATGNNGTGVAGVDWNVKYISGKFLGPDGGYISDAIAALDYFTDLKTRHGMNIVAVNNSWGGGGFSQALQDAIVRAAKADILFIAAAGNGGSDNVGDNNDAVPSYPSSFDTTAGAGYDSVIGVAAIASNGTLASFSNYGATSVDLAAPGVGIFSTLPGSAYGYMSGTSMATPHVTGTVALYAATHPGATASDIRNAILTGAADNPLPSLAGKVATGGRLDVPDTLAQSSTIIVQPNPPSDLQVTGVTNTAISLSWTDNATNESGFHVERSTDNGLTWSPAGDASADATTFTDTGLSAGTTYWYQVSAFNSAGVSDPTNIASGTTNVAPPPAPLTPSGLTATGVTTSTVSLSWADNAFDESGYTIQRSTDGSNWSNLNTSLPSDSNSYVDSGLAAATTYYYRVIAYRNEPAGTTPSRTYSDFSNVYATTTQAAVGTGTGLRADYYDNMLSESTTSPTSFSQTGWKFARTDAAVNFNWGTGAPATSAVKLGGDTFSIKWTGSIQPRFSDSYTFRFEENDGVGMWITINGVKQQLWTPTWDRLDGQAGDRTATEYTNSSPYESSPLALKAGVKYPVTIVYYEYTGSASAKLLWRSQTYQTQEVVPQTQLYQGPSGLKATVNSSSKITLTWTDNSSSETGFKIERSTDGATFTQIATVGANVTTYANTGLTANKTYYYRVRAYNGSPVFNSAYSNKASAKTLAAAVTAAELKPQAFSNQLISDSALLG